MSEPADHLKLVSEPAEPEDPLVGTVLDGRYLVEKVLGEGGMGLVYKAKHTTLNRPLAIKVLKSEVSKDDEVVQRFRQEAQSATSIGNEHIIDITDFGVLSDGSTYFVMEFLDGLSLTDVVEGGSAIESTRVIHIAKQLCKALGAAHEAGIVHRDLKPDNISLITRGGDSDFVKVLDFGIAKVGGAKSKLTQVGQVFGTPHYMSPEQCAGTAVDRRTDIYALGVILYEMCSARVPFDADNMMGILTKHLYEEPIALHELPPPVDVPSALEAIILKCLHKKPESRYQTMQEVYDDLVLADEGNTPNAVVEKVQRASSAGTPRPDETGQTALAMDVGDVAGMPSSNKGPMIAGVLIVLLLLGGGGAYVAMGGEEPKPPPPKPAVAEPVKPAPEPEPKPEPEPAPVAEPKKEVVKVTLNSNPAGAQVYSEGSLVGTTPFVLNRPEPGQPAVSFELRLDGYESLAVKVQSYTQESLTLPLKKVRKRRKRRDKDEDKPKDEAPTKKPPRRGPSVPKSEVLDPWS